MIKPIQVKNYISFKNKIKRKDVLQVVKENEIRQYEVRQAKMDATYEFINGKLVMVKSEATDNFVAKNKEYQEWLNGEI